MASSLGPSKHPCIMILPLVTLSRLPGGSAFHGTFSGHFIKVTGRISVSWHILSSTFSGHILWTFYQGYRKDQRFMVHSLGHLLWSFYQDYREDQRFMVHSLGHLLWSFYQDYREDQRFMVHSLGHLFWTHSLDILSRLPGGSAFHVRLSKQIN